MQKIFDWIIFKSTRCFCAQPRQWGDRKLTPRHRFNNLILPLSVKNTHIHCNTLLVFFMFVYYRPTLHNSFLDFSCVDLQFGENLKYTLRKCYCVKFLNKGGGKQHTSSYLSTSLFPHNMPVAPPNVWNQTYVLENVNKIPFIAPKYKPCLCHNLSQFPGLNRDGRDVIACRF